jgi:transcriptional regulator with XRE-family HTH domain
VRTEKSEGGTNVEEEILRQGTEQSADQKGKDEGEKKLASCERLMVQGVTRLSDLMKLLGVSRQKVASMRRKILKEWEEIANSAGTAHSLGRFVRKAELVERTAWTLFSEEEESTEKKTNVLKVILSAIEKEVELLQPRNGKARDEETEDSQQKLAECEQKVESIIGTLEKSGDQSSAQ